MRARDIMTTPVIGVTPSASLTEAVSLMTEYGFTTLPVVDQRGRLLGLICETDIIRARCPGDDETVSDPDSGVMTDRQAHRVASVMRTPGKGAAPDLDVTELAHRMADSGIRSLPVIELGHVIGMVTFQDVLGALAASRPS
ncbi:MULTISPECIES: HPP family protein [unclassified Amycolatopsis]|uniref:CBS domain-containing protein n=1 Tax=unclassified Amycolatopsis TaxID=2618356 RepID=UPI001C6A0466|nr:CBS domain-containing protein [Amycolatopsis sp. DSM 110486]QYN20272.1 CBS domain-containing protein [Amycolatopsis sp. DSM 110486]